jgi:hypothetical protein
MAADPPKDEGLEHLLQEISRTLGENQRFLQALKEDRIDEAEKSVESSGAEDDFEEL